MFFKAFSILKRILEEAFRSKEVSINVFDLSLSCLQMFVTYFKKTIFLFKNYLFENIETSHVVEIVVNFSNIFILALVKTKL